MKSFNYIIVEVDSDYNNEVKIAENLSVVVNSTIESVEHINRVAKVISAPSFTILEEGDEVIIHHNICRLRNGVSGEQTKSNYHLEDNKYFVPLTEVFMYKREGVWKAISPYCFVKPIKSEEIKSDLVVIDSSDTHKGMQKNIGIMSYPNPWLESQDINSGDTIAFSDDSEYEFKIDGEVYYKMSNNDILGKIE